METYSIKAKVKENLNTGDFLMYTNNSKFGILASGKTKDEADKNFVSSLRGACLVKTFFSIDNMIAKNQIDLKKIESEIHPHLEYQLV